MWTEEVATYSFIWAVFMGASVMLNRREHFKFDLLLNKLTGKSKNSLYLINDLILLVFSTGLFYLGIEAVQNFWNYTWVSIPGNKNGVCMDFNSNYGWNDDDIYICSHFT
ncbi:TRAP transporter small permease [Guptibacillus hwajinpoensis]|uniref:TRAP transporter small permease n=1 Tax=Guptibacillus hwajinpoensis TaxID=208199 RepID=UPI00273E39CE|nr:TRAP transporter small permease [Pseudalkalibacillus hwajinpoensis]WLR61826.1 TRAP transporter small permease [Pseudalkalibacillus hwajinpoensis]